MGLGRHDTENRLLFFVLAANHPLSTGGREGIIFSADDISCTYVGVQYIYIHRYGI